MSEESHLESPLGEEFEPDSFARMVAWLRRVSGYDPGAEDEEEDELAAARTQRWAGRSILFAAVILALLNAPSIRSWASTLDPSQPSEIIRKLADVWTDSMDQAGLEEPRRAIRRAYDNWKAWGGVEPAQTPPAAP
ncbi:hypothetical protein QO010_002041 [Caulobacter ginsengisoli]|uniref:DUF4129 domain-containing protein n=1 Tax=Caulobacter ginsengisoli TaxID=400775 RepID=A0ABU0IQG7_9CAUL|nr:hypothetical protein [Caulobacter ginsengisoli]MDQ0464260.1 hypothetical protein [Caulobacter ginsengisoli]